ncbi:MAG: AMP-binding protein, partial [Pseudomonadota bacterium]|nr:AMP-binding protein [Pseudomonadota bacterium]
MDNKACRSPALETALLQDDSVLDCAVLARPAESAVEHIAYVVIAGPFVPQRLHERLQARLPNAHLPQAYVPVAALPLTAEGQVDAAALARLAVCDAALIQRWEERLQALPGIGQAAVVIQETAESPPPLSLARLLPEWQAPAAPQRPAVLEAVSTRPALSSGGALRREIDDNLAQCLQRAVASTHGLVYVQPDGTEQAQSYGELWDDARRILAGLRQRGLRPQDKVIFQLDRGQDFISAFWACVLGGFVPVPVSIAPTYQQRNAGLDKLGNAWALLGRPLVLAGADLAADLGAWEIPPHNQRFTVATVDALRRTAPADDLHAGRPDDLALL